MKKPLRYFLYTLAILLSVGILGVMIYQAQDSFVKIWKEVQTKFLFLSLLSSVLIYVAMGMSLYEVLRIMGRRINKGAAIGIALVSTTVNYLISSLGASGFALRAHLLSRRRVPFGMCVTASIVITVLLYFVLAVIILQGSILMLFNSSATTMQLVQNFSLILVMCAVCVIITAFLFNNEWRSKGLRNIFRLLKGIRLKHRRAHALQRHRGAVERGRLPLADEDDRRRPRRLHDAHPLHRVRRDARARPRHVLLARFRQFRSRFPGRGVSTKRPQRRPRQSAAARPLYASSRTSRPSAADL